MPPLQPQNKVHGLVSRMPSTSRDKAELRAAMQDSVFEFTTLRRSKIALAVRAEHPDWSDERVAERVDEMQPEYPEYDPVVELAVMGADHRNTPELRRQANAEAAQYVRPKLKSIEFTADPASLEEQSARRELAGRLVGLLNAAASAKRDTAEDLAPPAPSSAPSGT